MAPLTETRRIQQVYRFVEDLNGTPLEMIYIPGGQFLMGQSEAEKAELLRQVDESTYQSSYARERPQHLVTVPPFFMGRYPVTQAQWRFVATLPQLEHDLSPDPARFKGDNHPVEQVNWFEAKEFCARLSQHTQRLYDLPSEAEWEYACRAGTTTPYHIGPTLTKDLANYNYNIGKTTPVGQYNHANAFGLSDLYGNVWEWCLDHWHKNYQGAPTDGSAWMEGDSSKRRILRGGSWIYNSRFCRSAYRGDSAPDYRSNDSGFRVVCRPRRVSSG